MEAAKGRGADIFIPFLTNQKGNIIMKSKFLNSLILAALAIPGVAMAADVETAEHKEGKHVIPETAHHTITSNVGLFSNYLYRGISQTGGKPAIQGGFDYARTGGFYAGVWGSSISWLTDSPAVTGATSAQVELDIYLGFKNSFATDLSYDIGFLRYNYPASYTATLPSGAAKADTNEIYGALSYSIVTAKYSYSLGDTFGISDAKGTSYVELNVSYPIPDAGVTLGAHYGKQTYKGSSTDALVAASSTPTYADYKLSVSKDFSGYAVGLAYSSTNANKVQYTSGTNKYLGKNVAVLSLARSF